MNIIIIIRISTTLVIINISSTIVVVISIFGEPKPGRIKPGRIKRAALSLQNQNYYICCFLIRPRLYASELLLIHFTRIQCNVAWYVIIGHNVI